VERAISVAPHHFPHFTVSTDPVVNEADGYPLGVEFINGVEDQWNENVR
jgi:hypothetical protein